MASSPLYRKSPAEMPGLLHIERPGESTGPQAADKVRGAGGSSPCRGLGQSPKALCRSIFRERCERPKARRKACALWALATGGGKATRSGAAKP